MILEIKSMGWRKLTFEGLVGVIRRICMKYTRSYGFLWNDLGYKIILHGVNAYLFLFFMHIWMLSMVDVAFYLYVI
jgi:hypothetical protein